MTAPTTTSKPATDKQRNLIDNLLTEKLITDEAQVVIDSAFANYRDDSKVASTFITFLFSMPRADGGKPRTPRFDPEPGVYLMDDTVYRVRISRSSGQWYAEACIKPDADSGRKSLDWKYFGKRVNLRDAVVMEDADAGKFLGYCIRCGAELTDPDSIARGMGPICANK